MTMTPTNPLELDHEAVIDADELTKRTNYEKLLAKLSHQSVIKNFDPYLDIAWDDPEMSVDPHDLRWTLPEYEPLGATSWYRALPADRQAEIGFGFMLQSMKVGLQFENLLKRGLLDYAFRLPDGDPEFRYIYHEVAEEVNHGMMFQEFVNRAPYQPAGMARWEKLAARPVIALARWFPPLFFLFVLGGEDPIDWVQREAARSRELPPIMARIIKIHTTEEARHLSFARHYLKRHTPRVGSLGLLRMRLVTPVMLAIMADMMMKPSPWVRKHFDIPREVVSAAYGRRNRVAVERKQAALAKVRSLCDEIGLRPRWICPVWSALGLG